MAISPLNPINQFIFGSPSSANQVSSAPRNLNPMNAIINDGYGGIAEQVKRDPAVIRTDNIANNFLEHTETFDEAARNLFDGSDLKQQPSASAVSRSSVPQSVIDYFNADLAKHYGMSAETAYQEALSNTAYQRAIKDMKAAGLNPATIFGAGRGSTAGGVSYVSPASSGGSGGYSAKSSGKLFDEGSYFGLSAIAGLIGMKATKSPTGFWIGQATAQGIMGALNKIIK